MNIKEFLGSNPLESVTQDAETAGKLACEAVGWNAEFIRGRWYAFATADELLDCKQLADNLNTIRELESAVIEKVGELKYIWKLVRLLSVNLEAKHIDMRDILKISRATAAQKLTAILLALSEIE